MPGSVQRNVFAIDEARDSAGWTAYVRQLKSKQGWSAGQCKQWVTDYQNYVKFGNEGAAKNFNGKYAALMGGEIENSDLRPNFTQLMKAMLRESKAAPGVGP